MQLASVVYAVHRAEGGQAHTPPSPDNAMQVVLKVRRLENIPGALLRLCPMMIQNTYGYPSLTLFA